MEPRSSFAEAYHNLSPKLRLKFGLAGISLAVGGIMFANYLEREFPADAQNPNAKTVTPLSSFLSKEGEQELDQLNAVPSKSTSNVDNESVERPSRITKSQLKERRNALKEMDAALLEREKLLRKMEEEK